MSWIGRKRLDRVLRGREVFADESSNHAGSISVLRAVSVLILVEALNLCIRSARGA